MSHKKVTVEEVECNRCGWKWFPKIKRDGTTSTPEVCSNIKCKSRYWNKARVYNLHNNSKQSTTTTAKKKQDGGARKK